MKIFKNELLNELNEMIPPQTGKVKQVMLFALLEGLIDGTVPVEDLKIFLENKKQ